MLPPPTHTHTQTRVMALFPGLPGWARKVKPIWILLKQETVSGSGIIYTLLQTDNNTSTSPLKFFTGRMPFLPPNQQRQSTDGKEMLPNQWEIKHAFNCSPFL